MYEAPYYLQVDVLFFQARENGVHYSIANERVLHPEFESHFGGRLTLGVDLHHDCWKGVLRFLHFHARTRQEKSGELFPTWTHPQLSSGGFTDNVYDMWRLHMGLGDLNLTCPLYVSDCLEFHPYFGLRYSEIRHKLRIYNRGGSIFPDSEEDVSMKNKFWGLGPMVGMETFWRLNSWISIFSRGAGSLTFGELYVHQGSEDQKNSEGLTIFNIFHQVRPIIDLALGLDFRYCAFHARIAWETYLLLGQNQFIRFVSEEMPANFVTNQGDLSLQGLSFGIGISF